MEGKQFWYVRQRYFDNGRVEVKIDYIFTSQKPNNRSNSLERYDEYFDSEKGAADFYALALKA